MEVVRATWSLIPLVSLLYNINIVVLLIVSLETFVFVILLSALLLFRCKDHQYMNQQGCLLLSMEWILADIRDNRIVQSLHENYF